MTITKETDIQGIIQENRIHSAATVPFHKARECHPGVGMWQHCGMLLAMGGHQTPGSRFFTETSPPRHDWFVDCHRVDLSLQDRWYQYDELFFTLSLAIGVSAMAHLTLKHYGCIATAITTTTTGITITITITITTTITTLPPPGLSPRSNKTWSYHRVLDMLPSVYMPL